MSLILKLFCLFFCLRLITAVYSLRNERKLIKKGAVQYGKLNSRVLTVLHVTFYFSCIIETYVSSAVFNRTSLFGLSVLSFAYIILLTVIYKLRDIWTLKIYIVPGHRLERSWLFKTFRHPNYFLNIIPELAGVALLCNAWITLVGLGPVYLTVLSIRIKQEENAMREVYKNSR